jgi:putative ABC transport system ATP-binding protein
MEVVLRGVHKVYNSGPRPNKVLDGADLVVPSGQFVAVTGPSGAGKSSLLYLLGCLDYPDFGEIHLGNRDVAKDGESLREKIRLRHIGFVFQDFRLLPALSVLENITLPMLLAGLSDAEARQRGRELLRMINMERERDQLTATLSGGQKQKVAIARALGNLPELLLADEPTGNLDATSTREILEVLQSINRSRTLTTIMVTHDPQAASFAERVLELDRGRLKEKGHDSAR